MQLDLSKYRAVFFDVDGVLRRGSMAIEGADRALASLRARNIKVGVITNNSGAHAEGIAQSLEKLGIHFYPHEIVSAVNGAAAWLAKQGKGSTAYVLGEKNVEEELSRWGITPLTEPEHVGYKCDYLVVGACRRIDYEMLTRALRVALNGARFVAINNDQTFPGADGMYPAAGATVGAVVGMLGREPEVLIGKPSPHLGFMALDMFGVTAAESLLVGDTICSDIQMGRVIGMDTVLVLTGNSKLGDISPENAPTYTLASVALLS